MEKKKNWIIALIIIIILLIIFILYLLFGKQKSFTITFNTDGGTEISNIEVKNNEIVELPDSPTKEGYKFVGWTNDEGNIIIKGTKVTKDLVLKANWIKNDVETVIATFNTDNGNEMDSIVIEKGKIILLPVVSIKDGYIFVGWLDGNGNFITKDMIVTNNIILKAMWIKKDAKTFTIKFDTDGGSNVGSIIVENGKVILLPINPTKKGYVFAGWVDENGNAITKDFIVNKDITIKALWKTQYTCPSDCLPSGDGSKCTKEVTTNMVTTSSCPSGYKLIEGQCLDVANQYHANSIDVSPWWSCNSSSDYMYTEIDESGLGAMMWCAKKTNKITKVGCPNGYTQSDNVCKKTEVLSCTIN